MNIYHGCSRTKLQRDLTDGSLLCSGRVKRIFCCSQISTAIVSSLHTEVLFRTTQHTPFTAESACDQLLISFHHKCCKIPLASADLHQICRDVRSASSLAPLVKEYSILPYACSRSIYLSHALCRDYPFITMCNCNVKHKHSFIKINKRAEWRKKKMNKMHTEAQTSRIMH